MDYTEDIAVLSLCAGYGGIELGLSAALENLMRIVAVEVEAYALANLVAKAEEGKLAIEALWPDLRTFPAERFRGCFDIITAGYPCQPFSVAGKRKGADDPRHLWPHIARIVQAVRPVWCFFENVSGHLTLGFPEVYRSLRLMGYKVEAGLFTAAEVGAPHRRERLFILAHARSTESGRLSNCQRKEDSTIRPTSKLADTRTQGLQKSARRKLKGFPNQAEQAGRCESCGVYAATSWPARPGRPQYEWEEPRVVGNALQRNNRTRQLGKSRQGIDKRPQCNSEETQSRLGRAVDGVTSRVDKLRLLGNGVVPQQAEKAFRYLMEKF